MARFQADGLGTNQSWTRVQRSRTRALGDGSETVQSGASVLEDDHETVQSQARVLGAGPETIQSGIRVLGNGPETVQRGARVMEDSPEASRVKASTWTLSESGEREVMRPVRLQQQAKRKQGSCSVKHRVHKGSCSARGLGFPEVWGPPEKQLQY